MMLHNQISGQVLEVEWPLGVTHSQLPDLERNFCHFARIPSPLADAVARSQTRLRLNFAALRYKAACLLP